ncbi:hypothetical protein NLX71_09460 [Paenibacillus sp. MZ04-78.2]|uniref:hypothetical protein n=1 Tax=Paenibacillus sp. MZ04-78.2 TaxID=2962034 RepID=UPI0020B8B2C9|nr:hypothetical protein [Paenibacillus sp. MZ04-78.2]MCP3773537.1 hypothetical protein [Paenibacillus sp. MZ04-78.2]
MKKIISSILLLVLLIFTTVPAFASVSEEVKKSPEYQKLRHYKQEFELRALNEDGSFATKVGGYGTMSMPDFFFGLIFIFQISTINCKFCLYSLGPV